MRILLGTDPQQLPGNRYRPVIQNLGPGLVYLDADENVSPDSGIQIDVDMIYEFPAAGGNSTGIWLVSDSESTDVRVITLG